MERKVTNPRIEDITGAKKDKKRYEAEIRPGQAGGVSVSEGQGGSGSNDTDDFSDNVDIVPVNLRIVKQVVRYDALGNQFVDVTFAWDPVEGYTGNYKLRVAQT
jgi:hypothetical protein